VSGSARLAAVRARVRQLPWAELSVAAALVAGWSLSIISRRTAGAPRLIGTHFVVTDIDYRNLIPDSQRGRLPQGH